MLSILGRIEFQIHNPNIRIKFFNKAIAKRRRGP